MVPLTMNCSALDGVLLSKRVIPSVAETPVLSSRFESSVPGLFFVGALSANTFGPLTRFAFGAGYAAERVVGWLEAAR